MSAESKKDVQMQVKIVSYDCEQDGIHSFTCLLSHRHGGTENSW
jgi:hypothetical protein